MVNSLDKTITITKTDIGKHIETCLAIAKELPDYFNEQGISDMSQDIQRHFLYVAMSSNGIVGFAIINEKSDYVAEISWMAVKSERHRQGIGSALVDHLDVDLKSQGFRVLEVKTLATHADISGFERTYAKTKQFYEKVGFLHLETIDPYPAWEPGNPCAIYIKIL